MKRVLTILLILTVLLGACAKTPVSTEPPTTVPTLKPATVPNTEPPTEPPTKPSTEPPTEPSTESPTEPPTELPTEPVTDPTEAHSELYIDWLSVEDVIRYFNEVVLDAEYINDGDATLLQKWVNPITYWIDGEPTDEDLARMNTIVATLNAIEGFPGISEGGSEWTSTLQIYFCTQQEMINRMGFGDGLDGAVTFWYNGYNEIYSAVICVRTDLNQFLRNSVLLEEIYNGLGPVQDTALRSDSIISQSYNEVQQMTKIDLLILQLLYHPDMKCGMTAAECEAVIRQLYY